MRRIKPLSGKIIDMNWHLPLTLFSLLIFTPFSALAGLGGDSSSIDKDNDGLSGHLKTGQSQSAFTVHEIDTGMQQIKEYMTLNGTVFAVTWHGMGSPDLRALLGSYADEVQTLDPQTSKQFRRQKRMTRSDHVIIEKFGHMRDIRGKAYVPQLMPNGVTSADINE